MFIKFKNQQGKENLSDGQIDADIAPEMAETSQLSSSEVLNLRDRKSVV